MGAVNDCQLRLPVSDRVAEIKNGILLIISAEKTSSQLIFYQKPQSARTMPAPSIVNPDRLISDICKALPFTFPVILRLVQYEYLIISAALPAMSQAIRGIPVPQNSRMLPHDLYDSA